MKYFDDVFCRVTSGQQPKFSTKRTWKRKGKTRFNAWKPKTAKLCSINVRSLFEWSPTPRFTILKLSSWSRPIGPLVTWTIRHQRVELCKDKNWQLRLEQRFFKNEWAHSFLSALLSECTSYWVHSLLSARFIERTPYECTPFWVHALLSALLIVQSLLSARFLLEFLKNICSSQKVNFGRQYNFSYSRHTWISWPLAFLLRGGNGGPVEEVSMR